MKKPLRTLYLFLAFLCFPLLAKGAVEEKIPRPRPDSSSTEKPLLQFKPNYPSAEIQTPRLQPDLLSVEQSSPDPLSTGTQAPVLRPNSLSVKQPSTELNSGSLSVENQAPVLRPSSISAESQTLGLQPDPLVVENQAPIRRPNSLSAETQAPLLRPSSASAESQTLELQPDPLVVENQAPLLRPDSAEPLSSDFHPDLVSVERSFESNPQALEEDFSPAPDWRVRMQILIDLRLLNLEEGPTKSNKADLRGPDLALSWEWRNQVRLFLKANLLHLFEYKNNNIDFNSDFKFENFIDNAYIEFRNIEGNPFAVVLGKRDLVLGAHDITKAIPIPYTFWENYQNKYDVIALSIKYKDQIELTVYEGENGDRGDLLNEGQGDFNIEEQSVGFLLKVTRDLNPSTQLTVAYNKQKNQHLSLREHEQKVTVGVKVELSDKVSTWLEGMYLIENPPLAVLTGDKGNWGASVGLSYQVSDNLTLVGNYNHIDEVSEELGLGFFMSCFFCSGRLKDQSQLNFQIYRSEYPEFGVMKSQNLIGLRWIMTWDEILYER